MVPSARHAAARMMLMANTRLPDVIDVFDHVCHNQEYWHGIDDKGHKAAEKYSYYHRQAQHAAEMMTAPNELF